jgi:hypothetical protein
MAQSVPRRAKNRPAGAETGTPAARNASRPGTGTPTACPYLWVTVLFSGVTVSPNLRASALR